MQYVYSNNSLYTTTDNISNYSTTIEILRVKVNGDPAEYTYSDPVSELTLGENTTVAHHHVYKSRYLNALREADEGELLVRIPEGCIQQVRQIIKGAYWNQTTMATSRG